MMVWRTMQESWVFENGSCDFLLLGLVSLSLHRNVIDLTRSMKVVLSDNGHRRDQFSTIQFTLVKNPCLLSFHWRSFSVWNFIRSKFLASRWYSTQSSRYTPICTVYDCNDIATYNVSRRYDACKCTVSSQSWRRTVFWLVLSNDSNSLFLGVSFSLPIENGSDWSLRTWLRRSQWVSWQL